MSVINTATRCVYHLSKGRVGRGQRQVSECTKVHSKLPSTLCVPSLPHVTKIYKDEGAHELKEPSAPNPLWLIPPSLVTDSYPTPPSSVLGYVDL